MTETKHTPGPWNWSRWPSELIGGSLSVYQIGPMRAVIYDDWRPRADGISEEENEANARLIAAAPELLEACKAAREFALEEIDLLCEGGVQVPSWLLKLQEQLRTAIAKATGEDHD